MTKSFKKSALLALILIALSACSNVKQKLGLVPSAPDEFTVVHRAPLSMPPDYTLRPPQPGAPRPQDEVTSEEAETTVLGGSQPTTAKAQGENAILSATGAESADPDIRGRVDWEAAQVKAPTNQPVTQRLVGWTGLTKPPQPQADVVNAKAEAARLQHDQTTGQAPTAGGPTPSTTENATDQ